MWVLTAKLHIHRDHIIPRRFWIREFSHWNLGREDVTAKRNKTHSERSGYDKKAYFAAFSIGKRTRCRVMVVNTAAKRYSRRRSKADWSKCNTEGVGGYDGTEIG